MRREVAFSVCARTDESGVGSPGPGSQVPCGRRAAIHRPPGPEVTGGGYRLCLSLPYLPILEPEQRTGLLHQHARNPGPLV